MWIFKFKTKILIFNINIIIYSYYLLILFTTAFLLLKELIRHNYSNIGIKLTINKQCLIIFNIIYSFYLLFIYNYYLLLLFTFCFEFIKN